jgi:hypothetical protein
VPSKLAPFFDLNSQTNSTFCSLPPITRLIAAYILIACRARDLSRKYILAYGAIYIVEIYFSITIQAIYYQSFNQEMENSLKNTTFIGFCLINYF